MKTNRRDRQRAMLLEALPYFLPQHLPVSLQALNVWAGACLQSHYGTYIKFTVPSWEYAVFANHLGEGWKGENTPSQAMKHWFPWHFQSLGCE